MTAAPPLRGISSMATRQVLAELTAAYAASAAEAGTVQIESVGGVDAAKRGVATISFVGEDNVEYRDIELTGVEHGGLLLDPFAGSGTLSVAAKRAGVRSIAIEAEERWCEVAANRLSQDVLDFGASA